MFKTIVWLPVRATILAGLFVFSMVSGCKKEPSRIEDFMSQPQIAAPAIYWECAIMVNDYVRTKRGWSEADFNVSYDGLDQESKGQVFRVSHVDTYREPVGIGGIGSSFFIHAICNKLQITGEFLQQ
ncbi:MAG: hypothetical protein CALGDGBN_02755 [Pseudomonadales bacterium]|nr:hypothetical protein [Pseudomonadales bacterium]